MPEEITSVILGSPGEFKAEHNEGEPEYVYVKPITKEAAQSNLLIATKSGQHVTLELVSDGRGAPNQAAAGGLPDRVPGCAELSHLRRLRSPGNAKRAGEGTEHREEFGGDTGTGSAPLSSLDEEFRQQENVNAPKWTKWEDKQIETSIGDMRQWSNETMISYSVLNSSNQPVEIVPPQIQITGRKATKKKRRKAKASSRISWRSGITG